MFLGTDFFSGKYAMQVPSTQTGGIKGVALSSGVYDQLYLSTDPTKTVDNIKDDWEYTTKINATYDINLDGGNSGFSLKNTDTIIIKAREVGTFSWVTLYTIPVNKISDFDFVKDYYFAKSGVAYEIMCISSLSGNVNSYETITINSLFDGICLADKTNFISTICNVEYPQITRNISSEVVGLNDNKLATVVSNSENNYDTGTISAAFLKIDNCSVLSSGQAFYRKDIIDWLCNKKPKVLKLDNGRRWLVQIIGTPTEEEDGHPDLWKISFDFVEIGNVDSESDLYNCNLSDVLPGVY